MIKGLFNLIKNLLFLKNDNDLIGITGLNRINEPVQKQAESKKKELTISELMRGEI